MKCPECHTEGSRVTATRNHGAVIERRRRCASCGHSWRTFEEPAGPAVRTRHPETPRPAA